MLEISSSNFCLIHIKIHSKIQQCPSEEWKKGIDLAIFYRNFWVYLRDFFFFSNIPLLKYLNCNSCLKSFRFQLIDFSVSRWLAIYAISIIIQIVKYANVLMNNEIYVFIPKSINCKFWTSFKFNARIGIIFICIESQL